MCRVMPWQQQDNTWLNDHGRLVLWEVKHHMNEPQLNYEGGTLATDCGTPPISRSHYLDNNLCKWVVGK
jgi:hypothetical protein